MSTYTVGIVGCGSMGEALAIGWQGYAKDTVQVKMCVKHQYQAQKMQELGVSSYFSLQDMGNCDVLFVAVRPEQVVHFLQEHAQAIENLGVSLVVSVAAGLLLANMRPHVAEHIAIARVMPNTPVTIGQGILGLCHEETFPPALMTMLTNICQPIGTVVAFEESLMNAFTALAGCAPAMHYHIMDSFVEAGVTVGLSREQSTTIAARLMRSCGNVAEIQKTHPAILREQSSAPRSMTIAGLNHLDTMGMRGHLITAVKESYKRGLEMEKE